MYELAIAPQRLIGLVVVHVFVGSVGVFLSYKLVELNWGVGAVGSISIGIGLIMAEWQIGTRIWEPTIVQYHQALLASLTGLVIGIGLVVSLFEPDTGEETSDEQRRVRDSGARSDRDSPTIPGGLEEDD